MAVRRLEQLELGELLGSLLSSIITAQEHSARATIDVIEAAGLVADDSSDNPPSFRTVSMRYRKRDANGEMAEFDIEIPLLTLINAPTVTVTQAALKFAYEILTAQFAAESSAQPASQSWPTGTKPVKLRGVLRSPSTNTPGGIRSSFAVEVNVVVRQETNPIGVQRLFGLAELGMTDRPAPPTASHASEP
jgi:hypothetical protein